MQLHLKNPLAFLDLETTGIQITKDRIIEIGIIKIDVDNTVEERRYLLHPGMPIPKESSMIHGIYDEHVKDCPTFSEKSREIYDYLNPCDIGGFNSNKFDVPILVEEFLRCELNFSIEQRNLIDVRNIFVLKERRDLTAAYQFYCDKELKNAHSALADARATYEVFTAQLEKYSDLKNDIQFLNNYSRNDTHIIDTAGRLIRIQGKPAFNFGKHKGRLVEDVLKEEPGYYAWIMRSDFALHTKHKLKEIKLALKL